MCEPVVEYSAIVVCRVVDLEVQLQWLLVGSESLSGDESYGGVRPDLDGESGVTDSIAIGI